MGHTNFNFTMRHKVSFSFQYSKNRRQIIKFIGIETFRERHIHALLNSSVKNFTLLSKKKFTARRTKWAQKMLFNLFRLMSLMFFKWNSEILYYFQFTGHTQEDDNEWDQNTHRRYVYIATSSNDWKSFHRRVKKRSENWKFCHVCNHCARENIPKRIKKKLSVETISLQLCTYNFHIWKLFWCSRIDIAPHILYILVGIKAFRRADTSAWERIEHVWGLSHDNVNNIKQFSVRA